MTVTRRQLLGAGGAAAAAPRFVPSRRSRLRIRRPSRRHGAVSRPSSPTGCGRVGSRASARPSCGTDAWGGHAASGSPTCGATSRSSQETLFMLASISKTVICTAVMQAVGGRALRPRRRRERHAAVPGADAEPSAPSDHHASSADAHLRDPRPVAGLGRPLLGGRLADPARRRSSRATSCGAATTSMRRTSLPALPGTQYRYSNVGASLAAYLVEVASGIGFDDGATNGSSDRWGWREPDGTWPTSRARTWPCRIAGRRWRPVQRATDSTATRTTPTARFARRRGTWAPTWAW